MCKASVQSWRERLVSKTGVEQMAFAFLSIDALWYFIYTQYKAVFSYLAAGSKVNLSASVVSLLSNSIPQGEKANK